MGIQGYTPEELAILTPDERSAIEADDSTDADEIAAIAGEGEADPGTDADADDSAAATTTEADPTDAAAAATTEEEPTIDDEGVFRFEAPADAAQRRTALRTERSEAFTKLMDGTITTEEYNAIETRVADDLETLAAQVSKAELATAMNEQQTAREWKKAVASHFDAAKAIGADYKANPKLHEEFDGLLKVFAAEAAAKGMSDVGLKASKYALEQAQLVMNARHGFKAAAAPGAKTQTAAEKAIAEANSVRHSLQTLSNIPAADRVLTDESPLAKVSTLEGEDLELYLASLSPADLKRLEMASNA